MRYPLCRHIKTNGLQCQSPSLRHGAFCYFHSRLHQRHTGFHHTPETRGYLIPGQHIELSPLEDRASVQVALSVVINALATGQLETKRATALLYGLQLASINSARLDLSPYPPEVVRSVHSTPDGLDLARPGATVEIDQVDPPDEPQTPNGPQMSDERKVPEAPDPYRSPAPLLPASSIPGDPPCGPALPPAV